MSASRTYRVQYVPTPTGIRFGRTEIIHITIAVIVLTIAFSLAFSDFFYNFDLYSQHTTIPIYIFLGAFAAVGTGFLLHELAHKVIAQKYGCWAEFRTNNFGLMLALITGLFGFVYAAPGAVYIAGRIDKGQNGRISIAGPMTNFIIALVFFSIFLIDPSILLLTYNVGGLPTTYFYLSIPLFVALINIFLAGFNMIPLMPLDGAKVVHWNIGIYIAFFALIIMFGIYVFFFNPYPMGFLQLSP